MKQLYSILESAKNQNRIHALSGLILLLWLIVNAERVHLSSSLTDAYDWRILYVLTVLYFSQAILAKKWIHRIIQGMYGFCIIYVLYDFTYMWQNSEYTFQEEFRLYWKVFLKIGVLMLLLWFSGKLKPECSNKKPFN
jgi:hypothetical protein